MTTTTWLTPVTANSARLHGALQTFSKQFFPLVVLLLSVWVPAHAQVTIWSEDFSGANQGWTATFDDCDGQGTAMVANNRFEVNDMEGNPCCPLGPTTGGGNGNDWTTNSIDISSFCNISVSVQYGSIGVFECSDAVNPIYGCQGDPFIDNGHDQMVFYYSINGGPFVQFGYQCGGGTGTKTVSCLAGSTITVRVEAANKSIGETYWFDNVTVTGFAPPTVNQPSDITVCSSTAVSVPITGSAGATFSWANNNVAIGLGASGTGNIGFTSANVATQQVGTITVTPGTTCCVGPPVMFDITVLPVPMVDDPPNITVCSGETVNVPFTGPGNPTYNWTNSNTAIGLGSSGSGDISFTAATVASNQTATITVNPTEGACPGIPQTFTILVSPGPTMNQPINVTACATTVVNIPFTGSPGNTYTWTNDNPAIGLGGSGTGTINFISANVGSQEDATITVTPSNANCTGIPLTFTISILPLPVMSDPPNITVCAGEPVMVNFMSTNNPAFNWTNNNTIIGLPGSGNSDISFTASNVASTQVATVTVTPAEGVCIGTPQSFTITVVPAPDVNPISDVSVCGGLPVNVNISGTTGATFNWTNSNGNIGLGGAGTGNISFTSATVSSTQVGNIIITPTLNGCDGNPLSFNITVNPLPTVNDPADVSVCGGSPVTVNFTGTGGPTFNWTNNNASIGLPASGSGNISFNTMNVATTQVATITVTPTNGGNCPGTAQTFTITVAPGPTMNQPADITVCGGDPVAVPFTGTPGATFGWTNNNTTVGLAASGVGNISFVTNPVTVQQIATVTVTPAIGTCMGASKTFTITVNPALSVNDPADISVCGGAPVSVNFTGNGVFNWTNNHTSIGLPASGTGNINFTTANVSSPDTATITVTPTGPGCPGTAQTFTIIVSPAPVMSAVADIDTCGGSQIVVNFVGTAGATFNWINSNPAIGLAGVGTGNLNFTAANVSTPDTATIIVLPAIGTCFGNSDTFTIIIKPSISVNPVANIGACSNDPVSVTFSGTNTNTFTWTNTNTNIGLGASGTGNISFNAANVSGTEVATITVTPVGTGCNSGPKTFTITVTNSPVVNPPADVTICSNSLVSLPFVGTPGATFTWTNDNPNIGLAAGGTGNLNFTAANLVTPEVGLITVTPSIGTCVGTPQSFFITINPGPTMTGPADLTACPFNIITINFVGTPAGVTFAWTNSNTNIGLMASGTSDVTFTAANVAIAETGTITATPSFGGCMGQTITFDITINKAPTVVAPPAQTVCSGQPISVNFTGTDNPTFNWVNDNTASGLGASGTGNISFTAVTTTTPIVSGIDVTPVENGCFGPTQGFNITVLPDPSVTQPANVTACGGNTVNIPFSGSAGAIFSWTNDNPAIGIPVSGTGNISFTAGNNATAQTANITVTPSAGTCMGTAQTFTVTINPVATITAVSDISTCSGQAQTINFSPAGTTFNWTNSNTNIGLGASGSGNISFTTSNVAATEIANITVNPTLNGCPGPAEVFQITVVSNPSVTNPGDQTFCAGSPININLSGTAGTTFNWTNSNTSIGLPASGSGPINFTAANVNSAQLGSITITPQAGACMGTPETFNITIDPGPTMTAPGDLVACAGDAITIPFAGLPIVGTTFSWTNNNTLIGVPASGMGDIAFTVPNVTGTQVSTISVIPSFNGCDGPAITFDITVHQQPNVIDPVDITVCAGQPIQVSFSGNVNPTFNWTNNNTNIGLAASGTGNINGIAANVATTTGGVIIVTPTENGCTGPAEFFNISVTPAPTMTAPNNVVTCSGSHVTVNFTGSAGSTFAWTNNNTTIGLGASGNGIIDFDAANVSTQQTAVIQVVPSANSCTGSAQTFVITINPLPTLTATIDKNACAGDNLNITFTGSAGAAFAWTNNNTSIGLGAAGNGNISFPAANVTTIQTAVIVVTPTANGCTGTPDVFNIVVTPTPTATAPANVSVCSGAQVNVPLSGSAGATFTWTNSNPAIGLAASGNGNISFTSAMVNTVQTGTISVTPHAGACAGIPVTFTITINPIPTATISGTLSICNGSSTTLTASGGATYGWNTMQNTAAITVNPTGNTTYNVTVSSAAGCTQQTSATVIVHQSDIEIIHQSSCDPADTGTVVLPLTNQFGCDSTVMIVTSLKLCPLMVSTSAMPAHCAGGSDGSVTFTVLSGGQPPYQFQWTNGASNGSGPINSPNMQILLPNLNAGNFSLTITDASGQFDTMLVVPIPSPTPIQIQATVTSSFNGFNVSCASSSDGSASAQASGGTGPYQYSWDTGSQGSVVGSLRPGLHEFTVTDAQGCTATASVILTAPPPIGMALTLARPDCGDTSVDAVVEASGGATPYTVSVDGNLISGFMPAIAAGQHKIRVTDANGCFSDSTITVIIPPAPVISLPADTSIQLGTAIRIDAVTNLLVWDSLSWSPIADSSCLDCLTQNWSPLRTQIYTVTIIDSFGCKAQADILIAVQRDNQVYIPNVFSPDGDGVEDFLWISTSPSVVSLEIARIYDRWGELVYELPAAIDPYVWQGWDGSFGKKSKRAEVGVYVYYMRFRLIDGTTVEYKGDVTLLSR